MIIIMAGLLTTAIIVVITIVLIRGKKKSNLSISNYEFLLEKNDRLLRLALKLAEKNVNSNHIYNYLKKRNYNSVIVYGMHYLGNTLIEILKDTDMVLVCGIDCNADNIISFINVIKPDDDIPEADVIIVTAIKSFSSIEERLHSKIKCPIISIEDVVYS